MDVPNPRTRAVHSAEGDRGVCELLNQDTSSIRATTGDVPPSTTAGRSVYAVARILQDGLAKKTAHTSQPHSLLESEKQLDYLQRSTAV